MIEGLSNDQLHGGRHGSGHRNQPDGVSRGCRPTGTGANAQRLMGPAVRREGIEGEIMQEMEELRGLLK